MTDSFPSMVDAEGEYMHREIHRIGGPDGDVSEITPWVRGRYRPGPDGFVQVWEDEWQDWSWMCGAYEDKQGRYIRVLHEFAHVQPKEPS